MTHRLCAALIGLTMIAIVGCAAPPRGPAAEVGPVVEPAIAPATRPAVVPADVSVVYGGRMNPRPLAAERYRQILGLAADGEAGRRAWFVLVLYNKDDHFTTDVYFEPEVRTARLRRGGCVRIDDLTERRRTAYRTVLARAGQELPPLQIELSPYLQVSRAGQPFGERLEVPPLDLMPFAPLPEDLLAGDAAPLTDAQWVDLIDTVRPRLADADKDGSPILRVVRDREHPRFIDVYGGWQEGGLCGGGRVARVLRMWNGKFEVQDVGMWVS